MSKPTTLYPSLLRRLALLDYPLPLKLHAYLLLSLGLGLTFFPRLIVGNTLFSTASRLLGCEPEVASRHEPGTIKDHPIPPDTLPAASRRNLNMAGLLALGLGLSYVGTSAFVGRPEENQLMYAAIPLRFAMSAAATVSWITDKEGRSIFKATVVAEDLVGSLWLLYVMRDWAGWGAFRW